MKKTLFLSAILGAALCSSAFAEDHTYTGTNNTKITLSGYSAQDTVTFQMGSTGTTNWFDSAQSTAAKILISDDASTTDVEGLNITNGNQSYVTFSGAVSGNGAIPKTGAGTNLNLNFTGNVTEYTGNITLNAGNAFVLRFGSTSNNASDAGTAPASSATKGVSGSGVITFKNNGNSTLVYNYASSENPVYITNEIKKNGGTSKVQFLGGASYVLTKNAAIDELTLSNTAALTVDSGATLALTAGTGWTITETPLASGNGYGTATYTRNFGTTLINNGTLTVNGNTASVTAGVVTASGHSSTYYVNEAASFANNTALANATKTVINNTMTVTQANGGSDGFFHQEVLINGGGKLVMSGKDLMGWSGSNVKKLTLEDGASIKLERTNDSEDTRFANETFNGSLVMKGGSSITGQITGTETAGGTWDIHTSSSISVEAGANATISTARLRTRRNNAEISVGNNATLLVTADLTKSEGNGVINKTGNGTLTITGTIANGITLNNNAGTTLVKDITLTGGAFKGVTFQNTMVNGTITLNEYTGDGKLQTALSSLTKSTAQGASSTINLGGGEYTFSAETTVNAHHLVFGGNTEINGHGYDSDGHTITLSNGASINTGANELKIESEATLMVTNGTSVTSGTIVLGHNQLTNPGFLSMTGGSITTGFIKKNADYADSDNTFTMTGGTLTFTKPATETVMVDGPETDEEGNPIPVEQTNTYNAIDGVTATITGGTLSTEQAAWKIDNANVTLGGVTISGANAATLSNVKLGGGTKIHTDTTVEGGITSLANVSGGYAFLVENNSTLTLTGADYDLSNAGAGIGIQENAELVVDSDATLTLKTFVYSSTNVADNGKLTVKEGGSVTMKGQGYRNGFLSSIDLDGSLTVNSGAEMSVNTLTGGATSSLTVDGTMNINMTSTIATLSGAGSLKLNNNLTVTTDSVELGALTLSNGADITVKNHNGTLTTGSLTVTGADSAMNANLIVSNGGTLNFSAGHALTMGCSVEIGDDVTVVIDEAIIEGIVSRGETVAIITEANAITSLDNKTWHFQNAAGQSLDWANLRLEVGVDGTSIVVAPEPATATLSLLALAALCARRKRH